MRAQVDRSGGVYKVAVEAIPATPRPSSRRWTRPRRVATQRRATARISTSISDLDILTGYNDEGDHRRFAQGVHAEGETSGSWT